MKQCVNGLVMKPMLFFSNTGVSFFATPEENWFISEILERIVCDETEYVYSVDLFRGDADKSFPLRSVELGMRLDEIERRGADKINDKTLVYAK
jgi:hypothetical protein